MVCLNVTNLSKWLMTKFVLRRSCCRKFPLDSRELSALFHRNTVVRERLQQLTLCTQRFERRLPVGWANSIFFRARSQPSTKEVISLRINHKWQRTASASTGHIRTWRTQLVRALWNKRLKKLNSLSDNTTCKTAENWNQLAGLLSVVVVRRWSHECLVREREAVTVDEWFAWPLLTSANVANFTCNYIISAL